MSVKTTPQEFENRVKSVWGDSIKLLTPYTKSSEKVLVHYNECGHEDWKNPHKILDGQGCSRCKYKKLSIAKTKTNDDFKQDLVNRNRNVELLSEYKGVKEKVTIRNLSCGHIYSASANNILNGSGCPVCHGMKDTKIFSQQIQNLYPNEYEIIGEYVNNRTPILVRHKCGFEWKVIPKDLLRRYRCPKCLNSYGEHIVEEILKSYSIPYEREKTFDGLKDKKLLRFDFICYFNNITYAIEVDGEQHFGESRSMYSKRYETIKYHDKLKNEFCKSNSIPLLRIPFNWINQKSKIESEIVSFFNIKL